MTALVNYSSSSSEEENEQLPLKTRKKRCAWARDFISGEPQPKERKSHSSHTASNEQGVDEKASSHTASNEQGVDEKAKNVLTALPRPDAIQRMFEDKTKTATSEDDPTLHGGRIRSFPHVEGNWASYIFVPVEPDTRLKAFVNQLLVCLRPLNFQLMDDLHLSLSRTVTIRHHWIQPLIETLKEKFAQLESCLCGIVSVKLYTNDEKTRTFVSLTLDDEGTSLLDYVSAVDQCFTDFNLPHFYKDPSFHISCLWCVGDVVSQISDKAKQQLQELTSDFLTNNSDLSILEIDDVCFKTGNKVFSFPLKGASS